MHLLKVELTMNDLLSYIFVIFYAFSTILVLKNLVTFPYSSYVFI